MQAVKLNCIRLFFAAEVASEHFELFKLTLTTQIQSKCKIFDQKKLKEKRKRSVKLKEILLWLIMSKKIDKGEIWDYETVKVDIKKLGKKTEVEN